MRGLPWIKDQSMLDDSEEESEEEHLHFDEEEVHDESEPEDLDNMETCKQVAEKDLAQRGLQDYCVVRHIDTWSSDTLRKFAQFGNVAILPQVCDAIRELAGKPVLVYEMAADKKETVTMSEQDLVRSLVRSGCNSGRRSSRQLSPEACGHGADCGRSRSTKVDGNIDACDISVQITGSGCEADEVHGAGEVWRQAQCDACRCAGSDCEHV